MEGRRIVGTAGDLVAAGASQEPGTPVVVAEPEVELGADRDRGVWVLVAEAVTLPANAAGAIAADDEPVAIITELSSTGVTRRLAGVPVLQLRARQLLSPGQLAAEALPADPAARRAVALDRPDGDMTDYLLEVVAELDQRRDELQDALHAVHQPLSPAARRRLTCVIDALEEARLHACAAIPYGDTCELARTGLVDDDQVCLPRRSDDLWVHLPASVGYGQGTGEPGCRRHAEVAVRAIAGARVGAVFDSDV
jgi:hypothetical protein